MVPAFLKDLDRAALAAVVVLAACSHTDPFSTPPFGTDTPFDPAPPVRLTLNFGPDRDPAWLPDGTGLVYVAQQLGRPDADACLAQLPATGGSQTRLDCDLGTGGAEQTNAVATPALSAGGRLAFVQASGSIGGSNPAREGLMVASTLDPSSATEVQRLAYTIPGEPQHSAIYDLRWQASDRLVFVGGLVSYRRLCSFCVIDTIASGLKVVLLDLAAPASGPAAVPGTDFASGVAPGSADEIYYTLGGDTRVYRRVLSSGAVDVVHDFGGAGIARDIHVAGTRLAAVVGGRVTFTIDPQLGPIQVDEGGILHLVDLASGTDLVLDGPGLFRRPALAPSGSALIAEGHPITIRDLGNGTMDTTVSRLSDLYRFDTP